MRPKPKLSPLDKKIKPNPRYEGVEAVVQTGSNLRTELEKLGELNELYKFRNNEVFRRITINNLVDLIIEVTKLEYQLKCFPPPTSKQTKRSQERTLRHQDDDIKNFGHKHHQLEETTDDCIDDLLRDQFDVKPVDQPPSSHRIQSSRSCVSITNGIGEMDETNPDIEINKASCRPYLILDVRDPELYRESHLSLAVSYPSMRLNRAFDYETPEMLRLKNKKNCVIVMYDDDETIASKCTTTLVQRGYENVFMLSGGLRVARLKYPESLVTDREIDRIEEGDIMVLEKLKEENVARGSYSRLTGSRQATGLSKKSKSGMPPPPSIRRSVSLDRPPPAGGRSFPGGGLPMGGTRRQGSRFEAPIRTSTALGGSKNSIFF